MAASRLFAKFRSVTESAFARWGEICHDHPLRILAVVLAALAGLSIALPSLQTDMSNEGYLREDDPARLNLKWFQTAFGRDDRIVVVLRSDADVIKPGVLNTVRQLHQALEELPQVNKVESLINARLTLGRDDELIVRDLMEDWPESADDYAALGTLIENRSLIRENFISRDGHGTLIIVTPDAYTASVSGAHDEPAALDAFDFDAGFEDMGLPGETDAASRPAELISDQEMFDLVLRIQALGKTYEREDLRVSFAGASYLTERLTHVLVRDMSVFSGLSIGITALLLLLVFRRWIMVILPISVALLSVYATFAIMATLGMTLTTASQILPSLLLAVGVGNSVHIFTVFFQALDRGDSKREALSYALGHSGLAVVLTGLTTAGGLASFITADMQTVAQIGVIAPIGILCALVFSLSLLPALIALTRFRNKGLRSDTSGPLQSFLSLCAELSTRYPGRVAGSWFVVLGLCMLAITQLRPSHNPLHWFPLGSEVRDSMDLVNEQFGGATYVEIVVDSGQTNGLHDPALLHNVDRAMQRAAHVELQGGRMGPSTSLLDINKELHQALNGNDPAFYRIPDNRELIAQELLLFENSGNEDLKDLVDSPFQMMRITAKVPFVDSLHYAPYLASLDQIFEEEMGSDVNVTLTGMTPLFATTVGYIITDTLRAYTVAFAIIAPLMMLLVGSVRVGLLSMIPNLAPIIITLAFMYLLGLPLDMFSTLVGCIALGLAVDDTIHFMHNYQRYRAKLGDAAAAVRETLRTTGKALMVTSIVLVAAFMVNAAGTMINVRNFGLITSFCIALAFLADVLLAPALVVLLDRWKTRGTGARQLRQQH